jgi:hypothetical protein
MPHFSLPTAPHISLLGVGCEERQLDALLRNYTHLSDLRVSFEELRFSFENLQNLQIES